MKILVVNLLRIGDFLQICPVLGGLRAKYPHAELDVLTFRGVDRLRAMTVGIDHWWTLDRDALQAGLGRADIPLLTSLDVLSEAIAGVDARGYDLVINLTHTEFSSNVVGLIGAGGRIGASRDVNGRAEIHGEWFKYLDHVARRPGADVVHHLDIFWHGCGLRGFEKTWTLGRTAAGRAEVEALVLGQARVIAVQPFTSDVAKDWGPERWVEALRELSTRHPGLSFALLGAPDEAARVTEIVARVPRAHAAITSLAGALSVIDRADLLLTGDTSIKHLAAATETPVIELCLGPSEFRRTGAYRPGSLIVAPPNGRAEEISISSIVDLADRVLRGLPPTSEAARIVDQVAGFWSTALASQALNDLREADI